MAWLDRLEAEHDNLAAAAAEHAHVWRATPRRSVKTSCSADASAAANAGCRSLRSMRTWARFSRARSAFTNDTWLIAHTQAATAAGAGQTTAAGGHGAAIKKQFAAVIELGDAVVEQARALPGLVRHYPRCEVVRCGPFRAPRLMLTHASLRCRATCGMPPRASRPPCRTGG